MMAVVFCRVEERLIHGQITCAWAKTLDFDAFVVVDDTAAGDEFMTSLLEMSGPNQKKLYVFDEAGAPAEIAKLGERLFLLAKSPVTFLNLYHNGVPIEKLNIGSVHFKPGKKEIYKTVCLSPAEIEALKELIGAGIPCEIQKLPTEGKRNVADLL